MSKSIPDYVNRLPKRSVTVYVLRSLDFVVPPHGRLRPRAGIRRKMGRSR